MLRSALVAVASRRRLARTGARSQSRRRRQRCVLRRGPGRDLPDLDGTAKSAAHHPLSGSVISPTYRARRRRHCARPRSRSIRRRRACRQTAHRRSPTPGPPDGRTIVTGEITLRLNDTPGRSTSAGARGRCGILPRRRSKRAGSSASLSKAGTSSSQAATAARCSLMRERSAQCARSAWVDRRQSRRMASRLPSAMTTAACRSSRYAAGGSSPSADACPVG